MTYTNDEKEKLAKMIGITFMAMDIVGYSDDEILSRCRELKTLHEELSRKEKNDNEKVS